MSKYLSDEVLESKEFKESISKGEFVTSKNNNKMKKLFLEAQKDLKNQTVMEKIKASQERKRLHKTTIHFYKTDMEIIKKVAEENGMSQQAFLRDFVHENLKLVASS